MLLDREALTKTLMTFAKEVINNKKYHAKYREFNRCLLDLCITVMKPPNGCFNMMQTFSSVFSSISEVMKIFFIVECLFTPFSKLVEVHKGCIEGPVKKEYECIYIFVCNFSNRTEIGPLRSVL